MIEWAQYMIDNMVKHGEIEKESEEKKNENNLSEKDLDSIAERVINKLNSTEKEDNSEENENEQESED